jgi:hypothetical protein
MAKQTFTTGQVLTSAQMTALQLNDYNQTVSAKVASYVLVAADAGTRITMSNAGATTITVNTSLFTAGDTLFITNIGAGASTITAGTATVSTASSLVLAQYDSGRLYFTSTGVAIWEKYQGAAGASGMTLIKRASFSGVATTTTTFDGVCTASYRSYLMVVETITSSGANASIYLQFRKSAVTHATSYYSVAAGIDTAGTAFSYLAAAQTQATLCKTGVSADYAPSISMTFGQMGNGAGYPLGSGTFYENNASRNGYVGMSTANNITADGFIFSASAGTITGTVAIYGLAI